MSHQATAVAALLTLVLAGCGASDEGAATGSGIPRVVATTTVVADLARNVSGDAADVRQVLPANADAHDYEPRPSDVTAAADADLVLQSGDGLDPWAREVVDQSGSDAPLVDLAEGLPVRRAGEEERYDPHWWHDPRNVVAAVERIRRALVEADPAREADFARNARAYTARVEALDARLAECFSRVPAARRKLVTDHDAFGYLVDRYAVTQVGAVISAQTTKAQSSAQDVARLTSLIRREGVEAVFPETSVNQDLAQAIAKETGATADLELYGDSLGPEGSAGATYLGMAQANADAMVRGFTGGAQRCAAPR